MDISLYILVKTPLFKLNSFRFVSDEFLCSLKLLRTFYAEDLVDHRTFLAWLTQQMITCNLAQAGFLACLAEEYLDDIIASRALARPLVEGCLAKLMEASNEMKLGL
jgi:hypothetical protein